MAPQPLRPKVSAAEIREQYLAALLAHIEKRKSYPAAARRRGIEGKVRVRFQLRCDGTTGEVSVQRGHKLLKRSALKSVKLARPLPRPPAQVACPLSVDYAMAYELK